jgi:hypothetical protein
MTEIQSEITPLRWKLLTKKRASSTQGLPPGKEHLAWVSNTVTLIFGRRAVTLIFGRRDAGLVDTFLTAEHAKDLLERQKPDHDLYHARPRRPLLWP